MSDSHIPDDAKKMDIGEFSFKTTSPTATYKSKIILTYTGGEKLVKTLKKEKNRILKEIKAKCEILSTTRDSEELFEEGVLKREILKTLKESINLSEDEEFWKVELPDIESD
ncbi:hypothetical protein ACFL35_04820 [Candidatus Riflebacteria bacterium]